jgi:hypothetical protein
MTSSDSKIQARALTGDTSGTPDGSESRAPETPGEAAVLAALGIELDAAGTATLTTEGWAGVSNAAKALAAAALALAA